MKKLFLILIVTLFAIPLFSQKRVSQVKSKEELLNEEYCSPLFNTSNADYFDLLDDRVNHSLPECTGLVTGPGGWFTNL